MMMKRTVATLLALLGVGCGTYRPVNAPIEQWDANYGYRPEAVNESRTTGDVVLILAFSGGGTRAAALSYGVLRELRDTSISVRGRRKSLLDEVDVITSVSGGSFASAYYGLFGDRIFDDFEERFLRRNVQGSLILGLLRPKNWFRLATTFFDRTELAIELYDREIFDGATFGDLLAADGPFLQINAADLGVGHRFTFIQPQFDLICSDLSQLKVARAVAASSAVPGLFNAITLRNYAGSCGLGRPAWLDEALADRSARRRFRSASIAESYLDARDRKYIHLVDGGIADNLGIRGPLEGILLAGGIRERLARLGVGHPRFIVVVVVNAQGQTSRRLDLIPGAPSLGAIINSVSGVQIQSYNFETIELLRTSMESWARELPPDSDGRSVQTYLIELAFETLADEEEREFFNNVATSFVLDDETVDRLIEVGGRLLRESPEFAKLLTELR
jgi:NTE family protein